jgi:hypothetical protein
LRLCELRVAGIGFREFLEKQVELALERLRGS